MLIVVYHHSEVRTQVESKERSIPETKNHHMLRFSRKIIPSFFHTEAGFLPITQLGEEEVKRKPSSQPGQAAQHWDPGQTGHRHLRWASLISRLCSWNRSSKYQKGTDCHYDEED